MGMDDFRITICVALEQLHATPSGVLDYLMLKVGEGASLAIKSRRGSEFNQPLPSPAL